MPVNIWLIVIPVIAVYCVLLWLLYRKSPKWALAVLGLTVIVTVIFILNTGVEKVYARQMTWKISAHSGQDIIEMTDDADDNLKLYFKSEKLAGHLRGANKEVVPVEVVVIYDFGNIRAFGVGRVDGLEPEQLGWGGGTFNRTEYLFEK
jgi:hypothetical protein